MNSPSHNVQTCEANLCKGLQLRWPWPPPAEEETTQQLLHAQKLLPQNTLLRSFALIFRGGAVQRHGLGKQAAHTCTFIALGFFTLWKKIFGTCCPGNRRSSMSLEVNAGLVTADQRPTAELRIWGGKSSTEQDIMQGEKWRGKQEDFKQSRRKVSCTLARLSYKGLDEEGPVQFANTSLWNSMETYIPYAVQSHHQQLE